MIDNFQTDNQTEHSTENMQNITNETFTPIPDCTTFNFVYNFLIIGTLCLLGIVGNTVSIIVLQKDHFNKVTVFLLQALAVADNSVLVMSFIMLSVIYGLLPYANGHTISKLAVPFLIKYFHPFAYLSKCCSIWITVLLAIYRYIAVCKPFLATKWCTMTKARLQLGLIVFVGTLLNLPRFFQFEIITKPLDNSNLTTDAYYTLKATSIGENTIFGKIYTNFLYTVIAVIIPLVCLVMLNTKLIMEIKKVRRRSEDSGHPMLEDDNITLIMVVIILVVLICHTPDRILELFKYFYGGLFTCGYPMFYVLNACNLMIIINSSVNFVIYYMLRRGFRQILMRRLCSGSGGGDDDGKTEHLTLAVTTTATRNGELTSLNGNRKHYGKENGTHYNV